MEVSTKKITTLTLTGDDARYSFASVCITPDQQVDVAYGELLDSVRCTHSSDIILPKDLHAALKMILKDPDVGLVQEYMDMFCAPLGLDVQNSVVKFLVRLCGKKGWTKDSANRIALIKWYRLLQAAATGKIPSLLESKQVVSEVIVYQI